MTDDGTTQPRLMFKQDGDDLVVTARVEVNNSPHVIWTCIDESRARVISKGEQVDDAKQVHRIALHYYVFQNRDLYCRSIKFVEVTWRMSGHEKGDETYELVQTFDPDSAELLDLLPKLEALARM